MKKWLSIFMSVVMLIGLMSGCGKKAESSPSAPAPSAPATSAPAAKPSEAPIVLKFSYDCTTEEIFHQVCLEMGDAIMERSNGSIVVECYPNQTLGDNADNIEQALRGAPIITNADAGFMMDYVPDMGVLQHAYLFDDTEQIKKVLESDWYHEIEKEAEAIGLKILPGNWLYGVRNILTDKVVTTPADLKGMKMRCPPNQMWISMFNSFGASPTTLAWSELYSALSQGVVDGCEGSMSAMLGSKLYEPCKHIALTGHFINWVVWPISLEVWNSMTEEQQTIVWEEMERFGDEQTKRLLASDTETRAALEAEGVQFNEVDKEAFKAAAMTGAADFEDVWTPGLMEKVLGIING